VVESLVAETSVAKLSFAASAPDSLPSSLGSIQYYHSTRRTNLAHGFSTLGNMRVLESISCQSLQGVSLLRNLQTLVLDLDDLPSIETPCAKELLECKSLTNFGIISRITQAAIGEESAWLNHVISPLVSRG
jgi:hypothetical protein